MLEILSPVLRHDEQVVLQVVTQAIDAGPVSKPLVLDRLGRQFDTARGGFSAFSAQTDKKEWGTPTLSPTG